MWEKAASIVGIVAALGAVWTRFVLLEARVDNSEQIVVELTQEIKSLSSNIQHLELEMAQDAACLKLTR